MSDSVPTLPTVMLPSGLAPQTPADLMANLIVIATGLSPGVTINLPATLIDDVAGTGTGALSQMDSMRIELVNSISPQGANPFLLYQMGQTYGVPVGQGSNGSTYVVFTVTDTSSTPLPGYVIPIGFTVGDGTNQYTVQDGGTTATNGQTVPLFVLATQSGTFAIPSGTVDQVVTSVNSAYVVTCSNPLPGTPQEDPQTISQYRSRVLTAGQATAVGTPQLIKTLVNNVPGVNPALTSVRSTGGGWEVLTAGSGDPYLIAGAIFQSVGDISRLVGSTLGVAGFTAANPGVVTTTLNHGFTTGQAIVIAGVSPGPYNGSYTITVTGQKTFSVGVNTSSFGAYSTGGVITPNFRNQSISLDYYPDVYVIPFVVSPSQSVTMAIQWSSVSPDFVSSTAVASLAAAAISQYVNGIPTGAPINIDVAKTVFQNAVSSAISVDLISNLAFSVAINGVSTAPTAGTVLVQGDIESYFVSTPASIVVEKV